MCLVQVADHAADEADFDEGVDCQDAQQDGQEEVWEGHGGWIADVFASETGGYQSRVR